MQTFLVHSQENQTLKMKQNAEKQFCDYYWCILITQIISHWAKMRITFLISIICEYKKKHYIKRNIKTNKYILILRRICRKQSCLCFLHVFDHFLNTRRCRFNVDDQKLLADHPLECAQSFFKNFFCRTCAYQGVKNVSFSENFTHVLNGWSLEPFHKDQYCDYF